MNILDLVFPITCLGCGKEGKYLCRQCISKEKLLKPACPYCEHPSIDGFTHSSCTHKYGLDGLTSVWDYGGVIKKAILSLKYKYATEIAKELNSYMVERLNGYKELLPSAYCLVPIPLYWYRENTRGFNQSDLIGRSLAKEFGWQYSPEYLIRTKLTPPQATLEVKARKSNLQGVFSVSPNHLAIQPFNNVLLFDDVFTTGSTLKEAAKVLKHAGVKKVWGLTIAR